MPSLGADMDAGTLRAWRRGPGDEVVRGDIIAEVETDKGIVEVEVYASGVVERLLVEPGTKVPVGTPLALIRAASEQTTPRVAIEKPRIATSVRSSTPSARKLARERDLDLSHLRGTGRHGSITRSDVAAIAGSVELAGVHEPAGTRLRASPLARARAAVLGVDLRRVEPTGRQGVVIAADVDRAAKAPTRLSAAEAGTQTGMRKAIAAAMARSKREIPHYYALHTIDMEPALEWLRDRNGERPVQRRLLPAVLFLRAVVLAIRDFPELNAHCDGGRAEPSEAVHLGVAVSLRGGGLVAPAILHAERLNIDQLMSEFQDLVLRARAGQLRASEMSSPTITVTSLGERGVEAVLPVIVPPQVAIVGFGAIQTRPYVVDEKVVARRLVVASLAADHRVSDGHRGGKFLAAIASRLKEPKEP